MSSFVDLDGVVADAQVAFNVKFEEGRKKYTPHHTKLANEVPSTSGSNAYGFLEEFPEIKEWLSERQLKELSTKEYIIKNRTFESSVQIKREEFEDNDYGKYSMIFEQYGRRAASYPDKLLFEAMRTGHEENSKGIDGVPFFYENHPVGDGFYSNIYGTPPVVTYGTALAVTKGKTAEDGPEQATTVEPVGDVAKPKWYMFDGNQGLKPFIYQNRRPIVMTSVTRPDDGTVFLNNKFLFGVDGRLDVGYGMWQCAAASYDDLNADTFNEVYDGMLSIKGSSGDPLEIVPSIIVVPVSLRAAAEKLILRAQLDNGEDNSNYKRVEIIVSPLL